MPDVPLRPVSRRLPSITEHPTPPSTPRRSTFGPDDGALPQEELGSLPPPPRTPRKRYEEQAEDSPTEHCKQSPSSITSFFQSLRVSRRLSSKPVRPGSPMPTPSPPNEFRKSGTFGVRDEDLLPSLPTPQIIPSPPVEVIPPRPPRRRQSLEQQSTQSVAGPSIQHQPTLPKWPHTPPASDANRESLEERDNPAERAAPSPLGHRHPEADLSMLIASHLLSNQATAMLNQSSSLREQADAMHRLAEQSTEWGRTVLAMADQDREIDRPQRATSINWGDLARDERRRRVVSLPAVNNLTLSLLEEAEELGAEGFSKLRAAEASWQKALATLREEAGSRPASMLTTKSEKRRRNKLRKQKSERTWWGRRKA